MGDRKPFVLDGGEETQKIIFDERKLFTGKGAVHFRLVLFAFLFIFFLSGGGGGGGRIGHATISLSLSPEGIGRRGIAPEMETIFNLFSVSLRCIKIFWTLANGTILRYVLLYDGAFSLFGG